MKKIFTFVALAGLTFSSAFAQNDWKEGDDISDQLEWQDYSGQSNDAGVWIFENGGGAYDWQSWEMFNQPKNAQLSQTFFLPAGYYQFSVQGFYRGDYQRPYWEKSEKINAVFFGESVNVDDALQVTEVTRETSAPLISIASSEYTDGRFLGTTNNWPDDIEYIYNDTHYYVPNSMEGTRRWFDAGLYLGNSIKVVQKEDGYFRIGVRKTATLANDWCIFSNFTATYLGEASEGVLVDIAKEDFQNKMNLVDEFREEIAIAGYSSLLYYYENFFAEIEEESDGYTSVEEYEQATQKLDQLVTEYKVYLNDAKALSSLISSCDDLANTTDYSGLPEFKTAIQNAKNVETDEFGADGTGVYTKSGADYGVALKELQQARAAYLVTKPNEDGVLDLTNLIAYPFFCQPEYNPEWNEAENRWVPQERVLNGENGLLGWADLGESGDGDNKTYQTTTRIPIGKGVTIGTDETVTNAWYQVNTGGYEPYWNHKLSSAKQWSMPGEEREIAQNLTGLQDGFYSIKGCGITWSNDWNGNCKMGIRIQSGDNFAQSQEETRLSGWWNYSLDDWTYYSTDMIQVTNGTARVAFFANGFSSFTGMQLLYYGENPDFSKLTQKKLDEITIKLDELMLQGDRDAVQKMLENVKMPVQGYDAYAAALSTIEEAQNYINEANGYLNSHDVTAMFSELQAKYEPDTNQSQYLDTAVGYTFELYNQETATYKDIMDCVNDYNEYVKYVGIVESYSSVNNEELQAKIQEQAQALIAEFAKADKLVEYEKELAVYYNQTIMAELGMDKASEDNPVDITALIVNPSFTEGQKGWTGNFTTDNGLQNSEAYNTNFRIEQTLYSLPAGLYTVKVKSFYRDGSFNAAYEHVWFDANFTPNVKFFANSNEKDVVSLCNEDAIFTERSYTQYTFDAVNPAAELGEENQTLNAWLDETENVDEDGNVTYTAVSYKEQFDTDGNISAVDANDAWIYDSWFDDGSERYFYPNSMRGAAARFANDNNAYLNEVSTVIKEGGSINFGLYKNTTIGDDWCMFDDFQLFYLGPVKNIAGDVNEDTKVDISDIVAVINQIAGTAEYRFADVNGDTKVDISDIVAIINIIAGQ